MEKKYFRFGVGVDISKSFFHAVFGAISTDGDFKVIRYKKFANSLTGFDKFSEWIIKNRDQNGGASIDLKVLMEVTGVYHESLLYYMYRKQYQVCLEMGARVKHYLTAIGHKSKNDKLDGQGISRMACELNPKTWKPVSEKILNIRSLMRHRKSLVASRTRLKNQLHANQRSEIKDSQVKVSLEELIVTMDKQIESIEARAKVLSESDPEFHRKLMMICDSVKGLAFVSVLTVVSETNGFEDFYNRKQLESYAGYDIVENSSGKFNGKTRISKKGNANIRTILYMSVLTTIRFKSKPFYSLYTRLMERNGGKSKKANVAVQRKLLLIIYTLWNKDEAFDMKYYESQKEVVPALC